MNKNSNEASTILSAIEQICQEKKISKEQVLEAIEQALASAYRKDFGNKLQNLKVEFDPETGQMKIFDEKTVVDDLPEEEKFFEEGEEEWAENEIISSATRREIKKNEKIEIEEKINKEKKETFATLPPEKQKETDLSAEGAELSIEEAEKKRFNPRTEIQISEAKESKFGNKKTIKVGDIIRQELEMPADFGRIAAQTAKQVIIQRLREAERETIYEKYKKQEGLVINGVVQRQERQITLIDLGEISAILPLTEQVREERYRPDQKIRVYVVSVEKTSKGPEIIVSRRHAEILKELFKSEIPEVANGVVEIKAIAREAGARSKVAVWTKEENIDPIGACIGQRGVRIQTVISEIGGEKIDIIEYDENPEKFIANALAPAKVSSLEIKEKEKMAIAKIKNNQLSLAIGRDGQNVRLAAKLTGWKIDIQEEIKEPEEAIVPVVPEKVAEAAENGKEENEKEKKDEKTEKTETAKKIKKGKVKTKKIL